MKDNVGRNDLCPCGSGKKYKKCHGIRSSVTTDHQSTDGRASMHIEYSERVRAYSVETLMSLPRTRPIPVVERIPLIFGGASSIPKNHNHLGMFERVYQCLPHLWDFNEDTKLLLFHEGQYQVELRRSGININKTNVNWKTTSNKSPAWDFSFPKQALDPQGYYCCLTMFVPSKLTQEIERLGRPAANALAGFISLTVTPDLVRTPIWEAACILEGENLVCQASIWNKIYRVGPPSIIPETFNTLNTLASTAIPKDSDTALNTALRFMGYEAQTQLEEERFIWLYLAIRVIVDNYFQMNKPDQQESKQEQRFRYYATCYFPGESELINEFKKIYELRNNLLKGITPTIITPEDVTATEALCHKLLKCEIEKPQ